MKYTKWLLLLATLGLIIPPNQIHAAGFSQAGAQTYLEAHAQNAWSTMALSALGDASIPSDYLKTISSTSAIDYASPILAISSIGQNPKTFGAEDYVAKLKSFDNADQIGDPATTNDDIFGLLALISAGESPSDTVVLDAKNFILNNQQANGGWGFAVSGGSDSNMTAAAIASLVAAGVSGSDSHITAGLNYLKTAQNTDGGFTYDPTSSFGTDSDSSSTAWVLWALNALSIDQSTWQKSGHAPKDYLQGQQNTDGWFMYQNNSSPDAFSPTTTSYATIALLGKTLPLKIYSNSGSGGGGGGGAPKFDFRIEGSTNTVCQGQVAAVTALDVVKNASSICGFTYHIKDTSFGPYLDKINDDQAAGTNGWLYLINSNSPPVGAQDYVMQSGDSIVWYFGDFNWLPTRLTLNSSHVSTGQSATATVEFFKDSTWQALSDANVFGGLATQSSGVSGHATLSLSDGYYKIFAEKTGYIRSNGVLLQVGQASATAINLSVNIQAGQVLGGTIAFIINPSNIDFGNLAPGQSKTAQVGATNTGYVAINLSAQSTGDSVFKDNLTIENTPLGTFSTGLAQGAEKDLHLKLSVPGNYAGGNGTKTSQVTFWATQQ